MSTSRRGPRAVAAMTEDRISSARRGYGSRWQKARESFIRANPLCIWCKRAGRVAATQVVDHITAPRMKEALESGDSALIAKAQALFWDKTNWQPLCQPCHDGEKQRLEKSGHVIGCNTQGIPLDPNHHWNRRRP